MHEHRDNNPRLALTTSKYYTPSGRNIQRDYTSFYDYYVADDSENGDQPETPLKDRKQYKTDTGRVVYGGGERKSDAYGAVATEHGRRGDVPKHRGSDRDDAELHGAGFPEWESVPGGIHQ